MRNKEVTPQEFILDTKKSHYRVKSNPFLGKLKNHEARVDEQFVNQPLLEFGLLKNRSRVLQNASLNSSQVSLPKTEK